MRNSDIQMVENPTEAAPKPDISTINENFLRIDAESAMDEVDRAKGSKLSGISER